MQDSRVEQLIFAPDYDEKRVYHDLVVLITKWVFLLSHCPNCVLAIFAQCVKTRFLRWFVFLVTRCLKVLKVHTDKWRKRSFDCVDHVPWFYFFFSIQFDFQLYLST
jgi:hypothetical protein